MARFGHLFYWPRLRLRGAITMLVTIMSPASCQDSIVEQIHRTIRSIRIAIDVAEVAGAVSSDSLFEPMLSHDSQVVVVHTTIIIDVGISACGYCHTITPARLVDIIAGSDRIGICGAWY